MNDCVFCGRKISRTLSLSFIFSFQATKESLVCAPCFEKFEAIDPKKACIGCFRKQANQEICQDCLHWREQVPDLPPKHVAMYSYNTIAKEFMNQFKFQGDILLAEMFSEALYTRLKNYQKSHTIVPIPLSRQSGKDRGFNQVERLLKLANISFESLLIHIGQEEKQSSKNRDKRMQTPQPFKLADASITTKEKILIVDDIYTTGRTMYHARAILEEYGKTETITLFR